MLNRKRKEKKIILQQSRFSYQFCLSLFKVTWGKKSCFNRNSFGKQCLFQSHCIDCRQRIFLARCTRAPIEMLLVFELFDVRLVPLATKILRNDCIMHLKCWRINWNSLQKSKNFELVTITNTLAGGNWWPMLIKKSKQSCSCWMAFDVHRFHYIFFFFILCFKYSTLQIKRNETARKPFSVLSAVSFLVPISNL